jgi:hypothetical protein
LLTDAARVFNRLGWLEQVRTLLEECQELYVRLGLVPPPAQCTDLIIGLGMLALHQSSLADAARPGAAASARICKSHTICRRARPGTKPLR